MLIESNDNIALPESIDYLFDNTQMDIITFLCILGCSKKKKIGLDELIFYYALIVSYADLIIDEGAIDLGGRDAKYDANSLYMYMNDHLKYILLYLSNNNLIAIFNEDGNYYKQTLVSITDSGKECVAKLENKYFIDLLTRGKNVMKTVKYNNFNKGKLYRGEYYDADNVE